MTRDEVINTETEAAVTKYRSMLNDQQWEPDATGLANFIAGGDSPLAFSYACEHGESYGGMVSEIIEKAKARFGI